MQCGTEYAMVNERKEATSRADQALMFLGTVWLIASSLLDLLAVYLSFGGVGVLLALTIAPLAFVLAPFYAAIALDFWLPLVVEYGGLAVLAVLVSLAGRRRADRP